MRNTIILGIRDTYWWVLHPFPSLIGKNVLTNGRTTDASHSLRLKKHEEKTECNSNNVFIEKLLTRKHLFCIDLFKSLFNSYFHHEPLPGELKYCFNIARCRLMYEKQSYEPRLSQTFRITRNLSTDTWTLHMADSKRFVIWTGNLNIIMLRHLSIFF